MLKQLVLMLAVLAPHSSVYVKGHSRAALRTRQHLQALTCYTLSAMPEASSAVLRVDHLLNRSGQPDVVMIFENSEGKMLWEGKAEESPWPLPSAVDRLLRRLGRSTCREATVQVVEKKGSPE
jgi:hypothetical protein